MSTVLLFLGGIGMQEILLVGLVILIFFGAKKIPEFMKGLGKGVREFKDGVKQIDGSLETEDDDKGQPVNQKRTESMTKA